MSTEHNFTVGSKQYNWIKETLAKIDRSVTPWVVFTGHRLLIVINDTNRTSFVCTCIILFDSKICWFLPNSMLVVNLCAQFVSNRQNF